MRSLVRAKLFAGTLSAGGGTCQVTFRVAGSLATSQVYSLPIGNRMPLVGMKVTGGKEVLDPKKTPRAREIAIRLLCEDATNMRKSFASGSGSRTTLNLTETRPAWSEDGPVHAEKLQLWRELIDACGEEIELPGAQRGLFVGISAIFYAAKAAGCDGQILARDVFLEKLRAKIEVLSASGGKGSGRDIANLVLVSGLVKFILHRTALIVCKRNWVIGEGGAEPADFAATWTLGMYLKHSGVMGIPLRV